ncbi:MAG: PIN domain-containing protein, partial [Terrimicrobiaceae bacterium]|nr:PIN domain-containing protein [Terrimicrobiaceae bacterium]
MNNVFDTTALVAYAFDQPGADKVEALLEDDASHFLISALSLFELANVLKKQGGGRHIATDWAICREIADMIPVDATVAQAAWELRERADARLPLADVKIAATAQAHG